jgi:hypothetical protein
MEARAEPQCGPSAMDNERAAPAAFAPQTKERIVLDGGPLVAMALRETLPVAASGSAATMMPPAGPAGRLLAGQSSACSFTYVRTPFDLGKTPIVEPCSTAQFSRTKYRGVGKCRPCRSGNGSN